ncbi:MAG: glycosyltransferase [Lachnospiraceae bacterium]|nr:glycosyltransferase [Lachnospiraceae bacterium]
MEPTVSIIVPIYNAEKTLARCVESVLKQAYRDFELILVNDGSSDSSAEICDSFAKDDSRVRAIHKENTGVSDTRNQGIAAARGTYVQFIDSDDWIAPDAVGLFVRTMEENDCDMVITDFYRVNGERVSQKGAIDTDGLMDRATFAQYMMQKPSDFYYGVLWNKLFKRSILKEHEMKMDTSISWCEDFIFNLEYILYVNKIYALKVPIYYYVKTKGSLVSQGMSMKKTIQMKRMVFAYYNNFYKEVLSEEDYEKRRLSVYRFLIDVAADGTISPIANYKLGDERTSVSDSVRTGEGFFFDMYREIKVLEKLFDVVALRNELQTDDVKVLFYLHESRVDCTFKETARILNMSRTQLSASLQRLTTKALIKAPEKPKKAEKAALKEKESELLQAAAQEAESAQTVKEEEKKKKKRRPDIKKYVILPEAEGILSEIMSALSDFEQIQYEGFTLEEIEECERLNARRNENIRKMLE